MEITKVEIVEVGVDLKIKIIVNGMAFYSVYAFDTTRQAKAVLTAYGLKETICI